MAGPFVLGLFHGIGVALARALFTRGFWIFVLLVIVLAPCALLVSFFANEGRDEQEQAEVPSQCDTRERAGREAPQETQAASTGTDGVDPNAAVPVEFLGAWEGLIDAGDDGTEQLLRIVIEQGAVCDEVVEVRSVSDEVFCEGTGRLASSEGSAIEFETTGGRSIPEGRCVDTSRQALRLNGSESLEWEWDLGAHAGVLRRVTESPDSVPAQYLGTWTGTVTPSWGSGARTKVIVIEDGSLGEDLVTAATYDDGFQCETIGILVSTEGGVVFFSHQVTYDEPEGRCRAVGMQEMVPQDDGSMRWSGGDYSGTLTRDS